MTVTLKLNPEVERGLLARAQERGVPLDVYIQELISNEAGAERVEKNGGSNLEGFANLSDLLLKSPFAGANLNLDRSADSPRSVDLE